MKTIAPPLRTGPLVIGAFWLVTAGAGLLWFNASQSSVEKEFENTAFAKRADVERSRANLIAFKRRAPHRDLIADVKTVGRVEPNVLCVQLKPTWKRETPANQKRIKNAWASLWLEIVKANPANRSKVQVQFELFEHEVFLGCERSLSGWLMVGFSGFEGYLAGARIAF